MRKRVGRKSAAVKIVLGILFVSAFGIYAALLYGIFFYDTEDAGDGSPVIHADSVEKLQYPEQTAAFDGREDDWRLLLVNPQKMLPKSFSIELKKLKNGQSVDERIYPDLQEMMDAARAAGLSPLICSSYRTGEKQQRLYERKVREYLRKGYAEKRAGEEAAKWVAVPGTSEHQTGLAVDIVAESYQMLDERQEETEEQQWLLENAWKYGFVLRYPKNNSEITGVNYEPWHYRYVGKEAAREMYEEGMCLEEYLESSDD